MTAAPWITTTGDALNLHRTLHLAAAGIGERACARGLVDVALAAASLAGYAGTLLHPGVYADERIEWVLSAAADHVPTNSARRSLCGTVHVLTEAYATGGHTAYTRRWISMAGGVHNVVLTSADSFVPPDLEAAATATGGGIVKLTPGRVVEQAGELNALCADADLVVHNSHMHDPVPPLSRLTFDRCPVVTIDHADHLGWIGPSTVTNYVIRSAGERLARRRRGLGDVTTFELPIPLEPRRLFPREQARAALAVPDDFVVIVTSGAGYKFASAGRLGFLDLVVPVIERHPKTVLIAEGPAMDDPRWSAAAARTEGRIVAMGLLTGDARDAVYGAADVCVAAIPFPSNTALLEAGSLGLPAVAFVPPDLEGTVLAPNNPGLEGGVVVETDPDRFTATLSEHITDADRRRASGRAFQDLVASTCSADPWRASLERIRSAFVTARPSGWSLPAEAAAADAVDHAVVSMQLATGNLGVLPALAGRTVQLEGAIR